jgi:hypothetical protein
VFLFFEVEDCGFVVVVVGQSREGGGETGFDFDVFI